MSTMLVAGGRVHAEFVRAVGYRGAGVHRLALEYTARPQDLPAGTVLSVTGEVWLDRPSGGWLGVVAPERPLVVRGDGEVVQYSLLLLVTNDTVASIERSRDGRDMSLRVDQRVVASAPPPGEYPAGDGQDTVRVSASDWAEVLEQIGQATHVLVMVPMDAADADSDRSLAVRRLLEARSAMRDGRYRDAIAAARGALEMLEQMAPPSSTPRRERDRDKKERFHDVLRAVKNVANAAHHDDDVARSFEWTYADATAVIAAAAALLQRLPDDQ